MICLPDDLTFGSKCIVFSSALRGWFVFIFLLTGIIKQFPLICYIAFEGTDFLVSGQSIARIELVQVPIEFVWMSWGSSTLSGSSFPLIILINKIACMKCMDLFSCWICMNVSTDCELFLRPYVTLPCWALLQILKHLWWNHV